MHNKEIRRLRQIILTYKYFEVQNENIITCKNMVTVHVSMVTAGKIKIQSNLY